MITETPHQSQGANLPGYAIGAGAFQTIPGAMNTIAEKHWLVVDDNEDILTMVSALFETITSAPIECHSSPQSALAAFAAAPDKYELVVTDYDMPGMNGAALCRVLKAAAPALKIVLSTGSDFFTLKSAQNAGFDGLLNKPCRLADMIATLTGIGVLKEAACVA